VVSLRIVRAVTGPVLAVVTGPVLMPATGRVLVVFVELVEMVADVAAATANKVDPHHDRHP
jgi:putative intracellular protease/amidase